LIGVLHKSYLLEFRALSLTIGKACSDNFLGLYRSGY
jgi:hypothetical protein